MLVVITAVIIIFEQRGRGKGGLARVSVGAARHLPPTRLGLWKWPALAFVSGVVFFSLILPAVGLAYWFLAGLESGLVGA